MKKIIIFKEEMVEGTKVRTILRSVKPGPTWQGYNAKTGAVIESEMKKLASTFEPTSTGCYSS